MRIQEQLTYLHYYMESASRRLNADYCLEEADGRVRYTMPLRRWDYIFEFTCKEKLSIPAATLLCKVRLGKGNDVYMLHELMNCVNPEDCRTTVFPILFSEGRIEMAVNQLLAYLREYEKEFDRILQEPALRERLESDRKKDYQIIAGIAWKGLDLKKEEDREWIEDMYRMTILHQMSCFDAYDSFKKGDYVKARRKYQKLVEKGKALVFENHLYEQLENAMQSDRIIPDPCPQGLLSVRPAEDTVKGMAGLIVGPAVAWAIILGAVTLACRWIRANGTLYYSIGWDFFLIIPFAGALLLGMLTGLATRRWQYHLKRQKEQEQLAFFYYSRIEDLILRGFTALLICLVLAATVYFSISGTRFYENRLVYDDASHFPIPHDHAVYYADVVSVYYIKGRWNDYDEYVNRGSYVLVMKDGQLEDMDGTIVRESKLEELFMQQEYFPFNPAQIEQVYSEREIPGE